ncbi:glycosyltransferase family 4 protein [Chryseosolibacter indicus]|uniref:Glycosyltransferase family 4 protein n=1 Tax=Chryseosolibacter indicus TaxID=2782351 RepID=A0ABS5VWD1_9BACT|nr:glycosyltransferase family 4 protein [Chryseosolibacter indicus]MBT1705733.1 glycosyltransferase family 4 protein [Chryseosolibacter indicus]
MRVAIVLNTSWNIYNFRMNFVKELMALGHEVHTIAPLDEYTRLLEEAGCQHHVIKMDSRGANPIKDSALILEFFMIYKKVKPDVILHFTIKPNVYGTFAATLLRIPVINNVCGLGTVFLKDNLLSAIAVFLYKVSFRFARRVFFQNPEDLQMFIEKKLVTNKTADLLPGSGIDLKKFHPTEYKRNEKFTFLLISRLITDKGVLEYIEAIQKLKSEGVNAKFQILGAIDEQHKRGIKSELIRKWIETETVEYLGTTDDVRTFIEKADCIVLPSYREGTPRTLLEAASSSKPIIATDVPGCNNVVVNNYNGMLCKIKDATDLADKMKSMSELKEEKLREFGRNGRLKMEAEFDESLVINKYLAALKKLE